MRCGPDASRWSLVVLTFSLAGSMNACRGWHREPIGPTLAALRPRDEVELWVAGRAYAVHGVLVGGDSVSAVPSLLPPECTSCALHFAFGSIDSVRVPVHSRGRTHQLATSVVVVSLGAVVVYVLLYLRGFSLF